MYEVCYERVIRRCENNNDIIHSMIYNLQILKIVSVCYTETVKFSCRIINAPNQEPRTWVQFANCDKFHFFLFFQRLVITKLNLAKISSFKLVVLKLILPIPACLSYRFLEFSVFSKGSCTYKSCQFT